MITSTTEKEWTDILAGLSLGDANDRPRFVAYDECYCLSRRDCAKMARQLVWHFASRTNGGEAKPSWVRCADRMPDPMTWVLVSDGENVREDRWYPWQEINGRGLLPTDPRRDPSKARPRWATYTNVTHWMSLPSAPRTTPNAEPSGPPSETVRAQGVGGSGCIALLDSEPLPEKDI